MREEPRQILSGLTSGASMNPIGRWVRLCFEVSWQLMTIETATFIGSSAVAFVICMRFRNDNMKWQLRVPERLLSWATQERSLRLFHLF